MTEATVSEPQWSLSTELPRHDLQQAVALVAEAAAAVAAHGSAGADPAGLRIADVELTPDGTVVAHAAFSPPHADPDAPLDALVALLREVAGQPPARGSVEDFILQRAVLDVAADAAAPHSAPHTPQQLADALDRCIDRDIDGGHPARRRGAAAAGFVAAAIVGLIALRPWASPSTQPEANVTTTAAPTSLESAPTTQETRSNDESAGGTTTSSAIGDASAPAVEHNGVRYEIGQMGDEVVVGDWWCRQTPTAAVLRPSAGELYLFPGWPEEGEETPAPTPIDVGTAAISLVVEPVPGCDRLVIRHRDGSEQLVVAGAGP